MPYLVNVYFQAKKIYSSVQETENEAILASEKTINKILDQYPENSQKWAESVSSYTITPVEETLLPNYSI